MLAFSSAICGFILFLVAPISKRRSPSIWTFAFGMLVLGGEQYCSALSLRSTDPVFIIHIQQWKFALTALLPSTWLLFSISYSRGKSTLSSTSLICLFVASFILPFALVASFPEGLALLERANDEHKPWTIALGHSGFIVHVILLISMITALGALERTFRASAGMQRWRIKYMLYGIGLLFAARFYTSSQIILTQKIEPELNSINSIALVLACLLTGRSLFRPGSFELDLYPSRKILTGSLTLSIAGVYLVLAGILSKVAVLIGVGDTQTINTLIMLATIVSFGILIQSDRFRQKLKRFVSQNFQRPIFDYRTLWIRVNEAASEHVESKQICTSVNRLVTDIFNLKLSNIWLVDAITQQFEQAASTIDGAPPSIPIELQKTLASELTESSLPFVLDRKKEDWAKEILDLNPSKFKDGGNRVCVPLVDRRKLVGFMVLGDRVSKLGFTQQELDTLSCIASHLASSISSAELSQKLAQSKEIEAFQTMATFFVHDLKNAVSTLNLMLKNMPQHWDNPEFREDALRGIKKTSDRISELIERLGNVRNELKLSMEKVCLEELLSDEVESWKCPDSIQFKLSPDQDKSEVLADRKKLGSVITNLLVNAAESISSQGQIEASTRKEADFVELTVSDNGSGMSEKFVKESLFRPFKTTKKQGLGIGMFQSKLIVEAHNGSIRVSSDEGTGTAITIKIPITN